MKVAGKNAINALVRDCCSLCLLEEEVSEELCEFILSLVYMAHKFSFSGRPLP